MGRGASWGCLGVGTGIFGISLAEACSGHKKPQKDLAPWDPNERPWDSKDRTPFHRENLWAHFGFQESKDDDAKRQRRQLIDIHPAFAALRASSKNTEKRSTNTGRH